MDVNVLRNRHHAAATLQRQGGGSNKLRRTQTLSGAGGSRSAALSGILNKEELEAGLGLSMSVSMARRKQVCLLSLVCLCLLIFAPVNDPSLARYLTLSLSFTHICHFPDPIYAGLNF